jgi:hypothetical protein
LWKVGDFGQAHGPELVEDPFLQVELILVHDLNQLGGASCQLTLTSECLEESNETAGQGDGESAEGPVAAGKQVDDATERG